MIDEWEYRCDNCGEEANPLMYWKDELPSGASETYVLCLDCHRLITQGELVPFDSEDANEAGLVESLIEDKEDTKEVPVTALAVVEKPKNVQCSSCFKNITNEAQYSNGKGGSLCKNCYSFQDTLKYFSENHEPGQKYLFKDKQHFIDIDTLRTYCTSPESYFHDLPGANVYGKPGDEYIFFDHGADVLFVGHLDIAGHSTDRTSFAYFQGDNTSKHYAWNRNLDDRLGVFIGHYLLPTQFGIQCDVLLTTNEESGGSTAQDYMKDWLASDPETRKEYNWVIEFDRREDRPVLYQYDGKEWRSAIEEFTKIAVGSLSDISYMDELGCKCVNWSTGYFNEHTSKHHAILEVTEESVLNFVGFYNKYKEVHFPHTYQARNTQSYGQRWSWEDGEWTGRTGHQYMSKCEVCGEFVWHRTYVMFNGVNKFACQNCTQKYGITSVSKGYVPILECEDCGATDAILYIRDGKDLCYECFTSSMRIITDEMLGVEEERFLPPDTRCTICGADEESYYEIDGGTYCESCYNTVYGAEG